MNNIEGAPDKSDYVDYYDFLNFRIDGYWLDELLEQFYPGNKYKGLIPTFDAERADERKVVWDRILPAHNKTSVCPVLICPDDCDFSCTLIVAAIRNDGSSVQWTRIGLDITNDREAEKAGSNVCWLDDFPELNFERSNYMTMLDHFKKQYGPDTIEMDKQSREQLK